MGLRSDIQTDLAAAFDDDLADAVTSFVIFKRSTDGGLYDPTTLENIPANKQYLPTTIGTTAYTNGTCRGVLSDQATSDQDNVRFNFKVKSLIVLNSELNSYEFNLDDNRYYVTISDIEYAIVDTVYDPASATVELLINEEQE